MCNYCSFGVDVKGVRIDKCDGFYGVKTIIDNPFEKQIKDDGLNT